MAWERYPRQGSSVYVREHLICVGTDRGRAPMELIKHVCVRKASVMLGMPYVCVGRSIGRSIDGIGMPHVCVGRASVEGEGHCRRGKSVEGVGGASMMQMERRWRGRSVDDADGALTMERP